MTRRPPRSTLDRSSAASDVYKRQGPPVAAPGADAAVAAVDPAAAAVHAGAASGSGPDARPEPVPGSRGRFAAQPLRPVSYTHLRAHETVLDLVCRLLLEKKK